MSKKVLAVARILLVFVLTIFLGLRIYVAHRIQPAQSAIADYQRLITSNASQNQIDKFMAKYQSYQMNGGIVIRTPSFPMLTRFGEYGYCEFHRADSIVGDLGQQLLLRIAESVGYSCFAVGITMGKEPNGQIVAYLDYEPAYSRPLLIHRDSRPIRNSERPRPYRIAEGSLRGLMGVVIGPDTPPEIASSITQVDVRCLRKFKGCSFPEMLPQAALRCALDEKNGFAPCR